MRTWRRSGGVSGLGCGGWSTAWRARRRPFAAGPAGWSGPSPGCGSAWGRGRCGPSGGSEARATAADPPPPGSKYWIRMSVSSEPRHRELGLTDYEYERIVEQLGREPNEVELAMFSLLWSEHCGYKHSRKLLRRLPTEGHRVIMGPGENAGAVDVGAGHAVAFKVESHNHPSAVEPFQGAATGVGGILRDVFALGARPIAVLDSLRFGEPGES